jgi:hypothetical protein
MLKAYTVDHPLPCARALSFAEAITSGMASLCIIRITRRKWLWHKATITKSRYAFQYAIREHTTNTGNAPECED